MATNQEGRHESFRAISGTSGNYNSDWLAAINADGITTSNINSAIIEWLQQRIPSTKTNINELQQEYAKSIGFNSWNDINMIPNVNTFTIQVKTDNTGTSNNDQFTNPTVSAGVYTGSMVDWGDGGALEYIDTYNDARWTHTFLGGAGTYTVKIYNKFQGISFNNGGDKSKLINISQWGIFDFGNVPGAFYGCNNLTSITATDKPGLTGTTDFSNNFRLTGSMLTIFGIASWNWSTVENMLATWLNSGFGSSLDGANFDSLNYLGYTFFGSNFNSLIGQDQVGGRLPLVTDMTHAYSYNTDFDQNLGVYNIENVTVMDNVADNSGLSQANYDLTLE